MIKKENDRIIRLCGDVIFKSVFLKEKDILLKMIYDIRMIEKIIGDDLLSMEKRTKLIASINDVVDNTRILQDWMIEENAKMKYEGQMAYAREEGLKQGSSIKEIELIRNMLAEGTNYDFISKITGKTIEEIKEIEEDIK